jgi:hypothetical protein
MIINASMTPISLPVRIQLKAGYQPDFVVREKAAYDITECSLEELRQTLVIESPPHLSGQHPHGMLRVHYFMSDGSIKQQTTRINVLEPVTDSIRYTPPGNLEGIVKRIGFSCDALDLSFTVQAFRVVKTA